MDEIREVEAELRRLREDAVHYKTEADRLKKEHKTLESRNEYLVNKLKEASYVYGEAGKRLLYFINNQVNPVTKRLNDLEAKMKDLGSKDRTLGESILSVEKTVKDDFTKADKRLAAITADILKMQEGTNRAIKASLRKSETDDAQLADRITSVMADSDAAMKSLDIALNKKTSSRLTAYEKKTDAKLDTLREHSLLMGKDIEALKKFEGDIQGLEGKLQVTVSNLTQTRLDMEKLAQRVKGEMDKTTAAVDDELLKVTADVNAKLLELSSDLKQTEERNMGEIRLEAEKTQTGLNKQIVSMKAGMTAFENGVNAKIKTAQAALKKDMTAFENGLEKRLKILESNISANAVSQKETERAINEKLQIMARHNDDTAQKIEMVSADLAGQLQSFKDLSTRREISIKNEMHRIGKSVDQKVGHAVLQLERKAGLMNKDIESLKALDVQIGKVITELGRRKEETAAIGAKVNSITQTLTGKSEKDDMKLSKQMEVLRSDVKNRLETAEARILKENVRSFSDARHSLKKDIHALRVENAGLKAEIRNLRNIGGVVNDLQQAFSVLQRRVDESVNNVEKVASGVSSDIEKQALKVSKDLAGVSAGLKADLKDILAREKERFAGQSAELQARYAEISKKVTALSGQEADSRQTAGASAKGLAVLGKRVDSLMDEIVGLKKEYKVEMGKLLKELEG